MGIEERQCEYYKCVASEYMIAYCNKCDKYFRRNSKYFCVYLNAPEMIYYEINICGYCQIKTKMTEEEIHVFEKEKDLEMQSGYSTRNIYNFTNNLKEK